MAQHHNALAPGYEIEGYRIEVILGAGSFGMTYRATELSLDRTVAIKEYFPTGVALRNPDGNTVRPASDDDQEEYTTGLDGFRTEARTLVSFRHPNIVPVYRFFEGNGTAYMVMEYIEGDSLAALLRQEGALPAARLRAIVDPLLDGLSKVHHVGFLHRDIKPDNIYIHKDGTPVLIDFGAARQATRNSSRGLTAIVTPGYAPWEQYHSGGDQGPWTDIYAMGGVLYRAIAGKQPPEATARFEEECLVPAAEAARGDYPPALLAAIDRALALRKADRPQSVDEWRRMLDCRDDGPVAAAAAKTPVAAVANEANPGPAAVADSPGTMLVGGANDAPEPAPPPDAENAGTRIVAGAAAPAAPAMPDGSPAPAARNPGAPPVRLIAAGLAGAVVLAGVAWAVVSAWQQAAVEEAAAQLAMEQASAAAETEALQLMAFNEGARFERELAALSYQQEVSAATARLARQRAEDEQIIEEARLRQEEFDAIEAARPPLEPRSAWDDDAEYEVANRIDGFDLTIWYSPLQIIGDSEGIRQECIELARSMASTIAGRRGRPVAATGNVRADIDRGIIDIRTRCEARIAVDYRQVVLPGTNTE